MCELNNLNQSILSGKCSVWALGKSTFLTFWLYRKDVSDERREEGDNRDNRIKQSKGHRDRDLFETRHFFLSEASYFEPTGVVLREALNLQRRFLWRGKSVVLAKRCSLKFVLSVNDLICFGTFCATLNIALILDSKYCILEWRWIWSLLCSDVLHL